MKYDVIFTTGYTDDVDFIAKALKCDILILDEKGKFYNPQFITLERIMGEFDKEKVCYLEDNLVILHEVTKNNILLSIQHLHHWKFYERWMPLNPDIVEKYFYPQEIWQVFSIVVE